MANRNRSAGNKWETDIVKRTSELLELRHYSPGGDVKIVDATIGTARLHSKALDDSKVDIWLKDRFINIQAKCVKGKLDYHAVLTSMPDDVIRVIYHKMVKKSGKRFLTVGEYAILPLDDFEKMLKVYHRWLQNDEDEPD